jgi:hypothetical protein
LESKGFGARKAGSALGAGRRYLDSMSTGAIKEAIFGKPDMAQIGVSHFERQNLNMRMGMRRFTRLTSAFPKKSPRTTPVPWPCTTSTANSAAPIRRCS